MYVQFTSCVYSEVKGSSKIGQNYKSLISTSVYFWLLLTLISRRQTERLVLSPPKVEIFLIFCNFLKSKVLSCSASGETTRMPGLLYYTSYQVLIYLWRIEYIIRIVVMLLKHLSLVNHFQLVLLKGHQVVWRSQPLLKRYAARVATCGNCIVHDYLSNDIQRTKINLNFISSEKKILDSRMNRFYGQLLFNIFNVVWIW